MQERHQQLFYLFISNGILLYGILGLGWPIFPVVYLWWCEGVLESIVNAIIRKQRGAPKSGIEELFPYAIYWLFIIVFIGLWGTPDEQRILSLGVVMFQVPLFNISLLILLLYAGFRLVRNEHFVPEPGITSRHIRLHAGILLGALALFLSPKIGVDGKTMMALVLLAIKLLLDLLSYRAIAASS